MGMGGQDGAAWCMEGRAAWVQGVRMVYGGRAVWGSTRYALHVKMVQCEAYGAGLCGVIWECTG